MHGSLARAPSESRIGFYPSEESRLDEGVQVPPAPRSRWHHVHPTVEPVHPDPSEHRRDVLKSLVLAPLLPNSLGLVRNERIPLPTSKEQAQGDLGEDAYPPPPQAAPATYRRASGSHEMSQRSCQKSRFLADEMIGRPATTLAVVNTPLAHVSKSWGEGAA